MDMNNASRGSLSRFTSYWEARLLFLLLIVASISRENPLAAHHKSAKSRYEMRPNEVVSVRGEESPTGLIMSPNYPNPAPFNSVSIVTLRATGGERESYDKILLTFEDMNLQTANNCEGESLNIFLIDRDDNVIDPNRLIYSLCGSLPTEPILLFSSNIVMQYVSDEFVTHSSSRFRIRYEFKESAVLGYCTQPNQFKCRNRKCISNELLCNGFDDCGDASDEDRWTPCEDLPTIPYTINYKCGRASFGSLLIEQSEEGAVQNEGLFANRIIGGSRPSVERNFQPQVSIQLIGIEPISHLCGGSLIHPLFVLTSAHCFSDELEAPSLKFLFGLRDLRRPYEGQVQVRYASRISSYPGFSPKLPEYGLNEFERANNIALVELNAPVFMNDYVWPACLPHLGEIITAGRECVQTGFGETRGSGHTFHLKQLKQSIVHGSECRSGFSEFKVDDYNMICVINRNSSGPCLGDSGGPLLCRNDDDDLREPINVSQPELKQRGARRPGEILEFLTFDDNNDDDEDDDPHKIARRRGKSPGQTRYTVHGVTSFTTDGNFGGGYCGHLESPTIYARISTRIEWILRVLRLALPQLNMEDNSQDKADKPGVFGYMFRSGLSQHSNFTPGMTIYAQ